MRIGRFLALDYGSHLVGLACCDELAVTVRPLPSVPNRSRRDLVLRLQDLIRDLRIEALIVGIPWNMNGSEGEAVRKVRNFIQLARETLPVAVHEVDERLTTHEALEVWKTMTPRQRRRYASVDSLAAALILERYLREE